MNSTWITDWSMIDDNAKYVVFAIGAKDDKSTYLYRPEVATGWQVKQRLAGCYAAIPMPDWNGGR